MLSTIFVDRSSDLIAIEGALGLEGGAQVIVYDARPASGYTTFLERTAQNGERHDHRVYVLSDVDDFYLSLIKGIRASSDGVKLLRAASQNCGVRDGLEILARMVPYLGTGMLATQQKLEAAGLLERNLPREIFFSALKLVAERGQRITFLVDDVAEYTTQIDEFLDLLQCISGLQAKIVFGVVGRPASVISTSDFSNRVFSTGVSVADLTFAAPDEEFIEEYIQTIAPECAIPHQRILDLSGGDIYAIKRHVSSGRSGELRSLNSIERTLLLVLRVAAQPIRFSDLVTLLMMNQQLVYVEAEEQITQAIQYLFSQNHLFSRVGGDGERFIGLRATAEADKIANSASKLIAKEVLYKYFARCFGRTTKHSDSELSGLLYRLAKEVDVVAVGNWSRELIRTCLGAGTIELAKEVLSKDLPDEAKLPIDLATDVTFHFVFKNYATALEKLTDKRHSVWVKRSNYLKVMKAICLNRCRKHKDAEREIKFLLKTNISTAEQNLLRSFYIAGLIHENKISVAQKEFERQTQGDDQSDAHAFLLRMASSIYNPKAALPYLQRAYEILENNGNEFGAASTEANIGLCLCELGNFKAGQEKLEAAYGRLIIFGAHHLTIVENNIGITKVKLGLVDEAILHFRKVSRVGGVMPSLYANINLAMAIAHKSKYEQAIECMEKIEDDVIKVPVDRVRQRYYLNKILLLYLSKAQSGLFEQNLALAKQNLDRKYPEKSAVTLHALQVELSLPYEKREAPHVTLSAHWQPCYLEYWYHDPLNILAESFRVTKSAVV